MKSGLDNLGNPIEGILTRVVVSTLLKAGYSIEVQNGEETELKASRNYSAIIKAMATTDEDHLILRGPSTSFVSLYYGNGENLVHDYGMTLDGTLGPKALDSEFMLKQVSAMLDKR